MIKAYINRILKFSGLRDMAVLSSGVFLSSLISFFCQPIATRLYSPQDFGVLSIIISTVSILVPILTLQYHVGIVTADSDNEANAICALSFYIVAIVSVFITLGMAIFTKLYPEIFMPAGNWIFFAIPLLLLNGINSIIDSFNNRSRQYTLMATVSFLRSIVLNALTLLFGLLNTGYSGLIISHLVSSIISIKRQAKYIFNNYRIIFSTSIKDIKNVSRKYLYQPLFSMPGLFVTTYSYSVLPMYINTLYGVEESGYFYLTISVLGLPLSLISANVSKVFLKNATAEKKAFGNFKKTYLSTLFLLSVMSICGFALLWFFAESLFTLVYGQEWSRSGELAKILIPMFAIRFIAQALMNGFIISGKQFIKLVLQCLFILEANIIYFYSDLKNLTIESFLYYINNAYSINYILILVVLYFTSQLGGRLNERSKSILRENQ